MVQQISEKYYSGEFLAREAPGTYSRDVVTFDNSGGALDLLVQAGTVYSFEGNTITDTPLAGNTGNGTLGNLQTNLIAAQLGAYVITLLTATTFSVTAPDGTPLENGATGTAYDDGISFLLTAGGTAFQAGDEFTVTIANGTAPVIAAVGGNHGNGSLTKVGVPMSAKALLGNYSVIFSGATTFGVIAPDGRQLAAGVIGTYYADEIGFLATAGSTAFVAADTFIVGVGPGTGLVQAYNGSQPAAGILYNSDFVPAGGTLKMTAIVRSAEVIGSALQWLATLPAGAQATAIAQLRAQPDPIIVR
jgi:hypothetical protein